MKQLYEVLFSFQNIWNLISYSLVSFAIILVCSHIFCRIVLAKKSLKLSNTSFVVITGGCMGIGKQMALEIARLYHSCIMIVDIRKDLFEQLNFELTNLGSTVQYQYCDLSDQKSVESFIKMLLQRKQKINLFIHNAGIHIPKRALQTSQKQFFFQYRVNFLSPVKIIRQTISLLEQGHLAVVTSMMAIIPGSVNVSTYMSTKSAFYSYINCLRQQLKADKKGITISMTCPYMIKTGMFKGFKTKLDLFLRCLDPKYVGKRLIKQFMQKKQIIYLYEYEAIIFKLIGLFPTQIIDYIGITFNDSNFEQIKDKHKNIIEKNK